MARSFGNDMDNTLEQASSFIGTGDIRPFSVSVWAKILNSGANQSLFSNYNTNSSQFYWQLASSGSNYLQRIYSGAYSGGGTSFAHTTSWMQLGVTFLADDSVKFYRDGVTDGTTTKAWGGSDTDGCTLAGLSFIGAAGFDLDGSLAEFAIWNVELTASEWAVLGSFAPPFVRPSALKGYAPLIRSNVDRVVGAWVTAGTVGVDEHPSIIYPTSTQIAIASGAAPAGNAVPQCLAQYRARRAG